MASDAKKIEKKMRILNTAFSLFRQNSVSSTAIDDIVKSAGIARGTFYLYFRDKSDLLEQVILYKSTEAMKAILKETFLQTENKNLSFPDTAKLFINLYIDFLNKNKDVLMILDKNLSSCLKDMPNFYDTEIQELYGEVIKRMTDFGYTEDMAHKTIFLIVEMTGSACSDAIIHAQPYTIEEIRDTITDSALCLLKHNAKISRGDQSETLK